MSEIGERVKKIVVEHLGVEPEKVVDNASFIDDLGADSLDTVELVMAFEEEFGCEIPDDAAEHILTVGDAVKFLEKNAIAAERERKAPGCEGYACVASSSQDLGWYRRSDAASKAHGPRCWPARTARA